ncbi:unnamed protein product [Chrysodeixis includens]|uniref:Uncharacterized protein n=1 Tax=Chrysodeixis includens TaxID=689277 RepID=A0A9P0BJX1_CHRIL|nr:unnamed protein product [Chrysodeixis includens]
MGSIRPLGAFGGQHQHPDWAAADEPLGLAGLLPPCLHIKKEESLTRPLSPFPPVTPSLITPSSRRPRQPMVYNRCHQTQYATSAQDLLVSDNGSANDPGNDSVDVLYTLTWHKDLQSRQTDCGQLDIGLYENSLRMRSATDLGL